MHDVKQFSLRTADDSESEFSYQGEMMCQVEIFEGMKCAP